MTYTPYASLTDDEFTTHVATKDNPTDEEVEAMLRIDRLNDEIAELREQLGARFKRPEVKYVTHA